MYFIVFGLPYYTWYNGLVKLLTATLNYKNRDKND